MAERAGFEPAVEFNPYDDLANRCFRPLSHLSGAEKLSNYPRNKVQGEFVLKCALTESSLSYRRRLPKDVRVLRDTRT